MDRRVNVTGRTNAYGFRTCCIAMLCWAGAGGAPAIAAQYDFGLGYALSYDSNLGKTSVDPRADVTQQLFGGFAFEERGPELYARLLAQAERRNFVHNTFADDTGFYLNSAALWTISPQQFTWSFEDVFQEVNVTLSSPDTPANRTKTNSLDTGPEFSFRVTPASTPIIGARYGRYDVQGSGGDSERYTGYARWLHQISASTTLSLNFAATRIYYDPPALDLSREDLFFRYEGASPLSRQMLDLGTTRVVQYGGQERSGRLARYTAQLSLTPESALRVFLTDHISDTYSDTVQVFSIPIVQEEAAAAPLVSASVSTAELYHSRRGNLAYAKRADPLGFDLQAYVRRVDYLSVPQDYDERGGRFRVSWLFTVEAQTYAFTQYTWRSFPQIPEEDTDRNTGVGVIYKPGRSLSLTVEVGRESRESTAPLSAYVNRRAMLVLGYSTGPLFSPRSRR